MAIASTKGSCGLCSKSFSKSGITRHLQKCRQKNIEGKDDAGRRPGRKRQGFHLVVEGRYRPEYWLHLEIARNVKLAALDHYLRQTWLECCGHLSSFVIGGRYHFLEDMEEFADIDDLDMKVSLRSVLGPRMKFFHQYDFGSTTWLTLRVVSEGSILVGPEGTRLLARNDPPAIPCVSCESPATTICTECSWHGEAFHCERCSLLHTSQSPNCEDMFLPVVNSPRMGECDYTGEEEDDWRT